jgi:hypothetical protein
MRLRIPASMVPAALRRLAVVAALLVATTAYGKTPDATSVVQRYGRLPVSFVENRGQTDPRVAFQAQAGDVALFFTRDGHSMRVARRDGEKTIAHVIRVELVDAATQKVEGRDATRATVSYFTGERDRWHAGIPTHGRIAYVQPWPGVDLEYRGQGGNLESVYVVAAHADASKIRLRYSGQQSLAVDAGGNLVYATTAGELRESAPVLFQQIDGRRVTVAGRYRIVDSDTVMFDIADYDHDHELVIDPTLTYAGYIGGGGIDSGRGVAADAAGNAYVVGTTYSNQATFPETVGPDLTFNGTGGDSDAFVAKINAAGTALVYCGYIGGTGGEFGTGIAVDAGGNAYITGSTYSSATSFPVLVGPDLTHNFGGADAFVAKINAAGTLLMYAGYIGGDDRDDAFAIAIDGTGSAYITGYTQSTEATFPVTVGPDASFNGGFNDAFVAKVNPSGLLAYAGYIGGDFGDTGYAIDVDAAGNAYVAGSTGSPENTFPVTVGPDLTISGSPDAFVAKVAANGTSLVYAGYVGGLLNDDARGIAVDAAGNAYITGITQSPPPGFPTVVGPDLTINGSDDAFVAKVNAAGTALVYSGYIGGAAADQGYAIAVDNAGNAYVAGRTSSLENTFPVVGGPDSVANGGADAFIAKVNASGATLGFAGYLGGLFTDQAFGIAVDAVGNTYVTGETDSTESSFPVLAGPDVSYNNATDAFIAKYNDFQDVIFASGFQ